VTGVCAATCPPSAGDRHGRMHVPELHRGLRRRGFDYCEPCGGEGQLCCLGQWCGPASACYSGTCQACGLSGQACCRGEVCVTRHLQQQQPLSVTDPRRGRCSAAPVRRPRDPVEGPPTTGIPCESVLDHAGNCLALRPAAWRGKDAGDADELAAATEHAVPYRELSRIAHAALRERVKELTCLYEMAQLSAGPVRELGEILGASWKSSAGPGSTPRSRRFAFVLDAREYTNLGFARARSGSRRTIMVRRRSAAVGLTCSTSSPGTSSTKDPSSGGAQSARGGGCPVAPWWSAGKPRRTDTLAGSTEAPRSARHLGCSPRGGPRIERTLNKRARLRPAGQKHPDLADQVRTDIGRIETAALQARGTIRKLLVFAVSRHRRRPTSI